MDTSPFLLAALARLAATPAGGRTFETLTAPFLAVLAAAVLARAEPDQWTRENGAPAVALRAAVSAWGVAADHVLLHSGPRLVERRLLDAVVRALGAGAMGSTPAWVARELDTAVDAWRAATD